MSRFAVEPANCNTLSDAAPTWRLPECPAPEFTVPPLDTKLSTLHVVESDHMDAEHYRALMRKMQANEISDTKTAADSGVRRRKRSR